ncbi:MAG: LutC/YkgG family protein [Adhaeribacter sp.]
MSSRQDILHRVKANKPSWQPLPAQLSFGQVPEEARPALFLQSITSAGGVALRVGSLAAVGAALEELFPGPERLLNTLPAVGYGQAPAAHYPSGHGLAQLELAVVAGSLAVAENGAVWVSEKDLPTRVLPFICEHLVLVVHRHQLVGTMHEAYDRLQVNQDGYGVFIAGPSRTADIEQSLVIGAHGPKRAHIFLVDDVADRNSGSQDLPLESSQG